MKPAYSTCHTHSYYMQEEDLKFTELKDPNDSAKLAFYTQIDNDPNKRAYLLPVPDTTQTGNRSKTIRVVLGDQSADGKYVFEKELIPGYTPPSNVELVDVATQTDDIDCGNDTQTGRESGGHCLIL